MGPPTACKEPVRVAVKDSASLSLVVVEGYLHPRGCMKARFTHLDLPLEPLRATVLGALASAPGGAKLRARPAGACVELEPPAGAPVTLCVEGLDLGSASGEAYLTVHRKGWIYLALPGLDTLAGGRGARRGRGRRGL